MVTWLQHDCRGNELIKFMEVRQVWWRFLLGHPVLAEAPQPDGSCHGWPLSTPLPFLRITSQTGAPPLYLGVYSRAFLLLGSPAFICQRMRRDMRWQATEALKHFRSKCPLSPFPLFFFSAIILFYLSPLFSFAHLGHPQTSTCRRTQTLHTCIVLSVSLSLTLTNTFGSSTMLRKLSIAFWKSLTPLSLLVLN